MASSVVLFFSAGGQSLELCWRRGVRADNMGGWWGWLEVRRGKQARCSCGRGQRYRRMYAWWIGNSGMEVALLGRGRGTSGGLAPWLPLGGCALLTEHSGQRAPRQAGGRPLQASKMRGKKNHSPSKKIKRRNRQKKGDVSPLSV